MNLRDVASSRSIMRLGMFFSQHAPNAVVDWTAWAVAGLLCRLKPAAYGIVKANLRPVLGPGADEAALERAIRGVFYSTMRSGHELFRALKLPREAADAWQAQVDIPEAVRAVARSLWKNEGGSVLIFPHLGSFDLAGVVLATFFPPIQTVSLPNPPRGFQWTNDLRERTGAKMTPLSPATLRQALRHLRAGGVVATAGDRPVSDLDDAIPFFGRPARVPSGHIRLALRAGAPVIVGYSPRLAETGRPTIRLDPPLEMIRTGNREEEVRINTQRVLQALEAPIRRWPDQWQMYVPVWPDPEPA